MSKALEDLEKLISVTCDGERLLARVKKALTPPTEQEVCEALSEWYGADIKHDYHQHDDINEVYMHDQFYFRKIKRDIDGKQYTIHKSIVVGDENGLSFNAYLPPHLITLIGRFYESKGGKRE